MDRISANIAKQVMNNKQEIILETERLYARKFELNDLENLYELLSDEEVMRYYPKTLSKDETKEWLERILDNYENDGVSWWTVYLKASDEFIGQAGIVCREVEGQKQFMTAYMLHKKFWGRGYATEAVRALIDYGFNKIGLKKIITLIRPENFPSVKVAERLNMKFEKRICYAGFEHNFYLIEKFINHK